MTNDIRLRIAPSPTGSIHVGLARTTLYNLLYTRKHNGTFVLRIEDTDEKRSTKESEQQILEGFAWLGIAYDEGPDREGEYGPYRQSERTSIYRQYLEQLLAEKKIYPCFCSTEELEQERTAQQKEGQPPIYSGKCRSYSDEERAKREQAGTKPIYRFASVPGEIIVHDLIRGDVVFHAEHIGDFSIARDLDHPLYNFAVAIDDALMKISHVIRGEEHLSNTPKQILLFQTFGWDVPVYAHLPLLLGTDRKKLSKRDGATSVGEYRDQGFVAEALLNFLALLGWHPKDEQETFSFEELVATFHLEDVQKGGAIFDHKKLESINARYLRTFSPETVVERAGERLDDLRAMTSPQQLLKAVEYVQERLVTLNDLVPALSFLLGTDEYDAELLVPAKGEKGRTKQALTDLREFFGSFEEEILPEVGELKDKTMSWLKEHGYTNAESLWPLRVALTGQKNSTGVFEVASICGKKIVCDRIDVAIAQL